MELYHLHIQKGRHCLHACIRTYYKRILCWRRTKVCGKKSNQPMTVFKALHSVQRKTLLPHLQTKYGMSYHETSICIQSNEQPYCLNCQWSEIGTTCLTLLHNEQLVCHLRSINANAACWISWENARKILLKYFVSNGKDRLLFTSARLSSMMN